MAIKKELTAVTHLKSWPVGIKGLEDWHSNLTFVHVDPHIPITDLQVLLHLAIQFLEMIEQRVYFKKNHLIFISIDL